MREEIVDTSVDLRQKTKFTLSHTGPGSLSHSNKYFPPSHLPSPHRNEPIRAASQMALVVKNPPANTRDAGSIPGFRRSPGVGNGNLLQCSSLENSMDRGAWWMIVHGAAESLAGYSPWSHRESDTTEHTQLTCNTCILVRVWAKYKEA